MARRGASGIARLLVVVVAGCNATAIDNGEVDGSGGAGTGSNSDAPGRNGSSDSSGAGGAQAPSGSSAPATGGSGGEILVSTASAATTSPGTSATSSVSTSTSSGGASSSVVTAGSPSTSTTGSTPVTGTPILIDNGWGSAEALGIQGAFYTFDDNDDGGTFVISPASFETAGSELCAYGTAEQVSNMDYGIYWGGAIGFNLNQPEGDDAASLPYDATAHGVTGIGFAIGPLPIGGQLRFNIYVGGDTNSYCTSIVTDSYTEYRWEDLLANCWAAEALTADPTQIEAIHWQIVTNDAADYTFDFCITDLTALTD